MKLRSTLRLAAIAGWTCLAFSLLINYTAYPARQWLSAAGLGISGRLSDGFDGVANGIVCTLHIIPEQLCADVTGADAQKGHVLFCDDSMSPLQCLDPVLWFFLALPTATAMLLLEFSYLCRFYSDTRVRKTVMTASERILSLSMLVFALFLSAPQLFSPGAVFRIPLEFTDCIAMAQQCSLAPTQISSSGLLVVVPLILFILELGWELYRLWLSRKPSMS
jgi:hypothetical protein